MTPADILNQLPLEHRRTPITVAQWEIQIKELESYIASSHPRHPCNNGRAQRKINDLQQAILLLKGLWPWLTDEVIAAGHTFTHCGDCGAEL